MTGKSIFAVLFLILSLQITGFFSGVEAKLEERFINDDLEKMEDFLDDNDFKGNQIEPENQIDPEEDSDSLLEDGRDKKDEVHENEPDDDDEEQEDYANEEEDSNKRIKPVTLPTYHDSCDETMCQMKITPIGCYHDSQVKRPLPLLLDSHRDVTSHAFHGAIFDWRNGEKSIRKLACDCVKKARKYGYSHIGLQFYGECWSSKTAASDFAKDGVSKSCVNGKYKACADGEFCVGQSETNYVYRIDPLTKQGSICHTKFEKIGCFYDPVKTKSRPLPELLDSHRDITSHAHHGNLINWDNYRASLEKLVCHCAEKAKKLGHTHFGIEYYGECWSGKHSAKTYNKYGSSQNCISYNFAKCDPKSDCLCAGKGHALFVYKVK